MIHRCLTMRTSWFRVSCSRRRCRFRRRRRILSRYHRCNGKCEDKQHGKSQAKNFPCHLLILLFCYKILIVLSQSESNSKMRPQTAAKLRCFAYLHSYRKQFYRCNH
jgi:hypothetical protein